MQSFSNQGSQEDMMVQFDQEVEESLVPVFVFFHADWCSSCKGLYPLIRELGEVQYLDRVSFIDVDIDEFYECAERYVINSLPTFIIFKDGAEFDRRLGAQSIAQLTKWIDGCL